MARRKIEYEPTDAKLRGGDLKRDPSDLATDFLVHAGIYGMFNKMTQAFPASVDLLSAWADDATDGLYSMLRDRAGAFVRFFNTPYGGGVPSFVLTDPTSGSLLFGAMRGLTVQVSLAGRLPPPAPVNSPIPVPASWADDAAVVGWVRTVLRAMADQERLHAILQRTVGRTRLRPWTTLAAFSPAYAGWYGHSFRPTVDLWRAMPEPDIAFVEKLMLNLLLHARHPEVIGQAVTVSSTKGGKP